MGESSSSEQQNGNSSGSNHTKESLYDKYQKELLPSSDEKSSKGKFGFDNLFKGGDPTSNSSNKNQQKDEPAAPSDMATQAQNSSFQGQGRSSRRTKYPKNYQYPPKVRGFERDEMSLEIMLVEDGKDDSFKSIGVVGPPGVGKTTLCKLILKNQRVKDSYDRMIWVSLSESEKEKPKSTKEGENKEIVTEEEVLVEHIFGEYEISRLLNGLNEQLKKKKCLIVVDDVDEREGEGDSFHEVLKTCFRHESCELPRKKGGTIIVISRSEKATKKVMVGEKLLFHRLMPLSDIRSCWSIYMDAVKGRATPEDTNASKEVMEELVKKCGGLPGAAKMLGEIKKDRMEKDLHQKHNINTHS